MPDSGPIDALVSAAQESLAEIQPLHDYRAMFVRVAFGGVQAGCALALAVDRLASAVLAVVTTTEENP